MPASAGPLPLRRRSEPFEALRDAADAAAEVPTVLDVVTPEGIELPELLESYQDATAKLKEIPSWHHIVAAIGELYSEGSLAARPDFAWELSPAVRARALEGCAGVERP